MTGTVCGATAGLNRSVPTTTPTWLDLAPADLSTRQLHDLLRLRNEVFIVEQDCPYPDIDGHDLAATTRHLLALDGDNLLACSRFLAGPAAVRIGRIVVAPGGRGTGLGRELVARSLDLCLAHWPGRPVLISAQAHLRRFYEELGFVATGSEYDEDGIPHLDMQLRVDGGAPASRTQ